MQPFASYRSSRERARERRSIIAAVLVALLLIVMTVFALEAQGAEHYEEDENGNINQRNIGAFKSKSLVLARPSDITISKKTRAVHPFKRLFLKAPVKLVYRESGPVRIELEASQAMHRAIQTEVAQGALVIRSSDTLLDSFPTVYVYGRRLESVTIEGAADASFEGISVNQFELRVLGSADVVVSGEARDCTLDARSASDIDLSALHCDRMNLTAFGATDIRLQVKDSIEGRVQGAGDLEIVGQPKRRELNVMGAYDIEYM